jgi:uncharacterized protein (DUF488 family)
MTVYTVGHSTRTFEGFLALLKKFRVGLLVDIRTLPGSKRHPQFNQENLKPALRRAGIRYLHLPSLGGLRKTRRDSVNTAWRNASFRGYADYMQTRDFVKAIRDLMRRVRGRTSAVVCAEAVPWRCHRSLVADALSVRGVKVVHLLSVTQAREHKTTSFAKVKGTKITYPLRPERRPQPERVELRRAAA